MISDRMRLLRLLGGASPGLAVALYGTHAGVAVVPTLTALTAGNVIAAMRDPAADGPAVAPIAALGLVLFAGQFVTLGRDALGTILALRIDGRVRSAVRELALFPTEIGHLESPDFTDDAVRAADRSGAIGLNRSAGTAAVGQVMVMFRMLAAFLSAGLLAVYFPVLALGLFVVALAVRAVIRRQWTMLAGTVDSSAGDERKVIYLSELAVRAAATEVRVFRMADWLGGRFRAAAYRAIAPTWRRLWPVLRRQWMTLVVLGAAGAAAMGVPAAATLHGDLQPGQLVTCLLAVTGVFAIASMGGEAFDIEYGVKAVRALDRLTDRYGRATVPDRPGRSRVIRRSPAAVPVGPSADRPPLVRFEDVTFGYPGAERPVFAGLSLTLRPGESIAVVGENGVGKTTLMKLLTGLYRPTRGRIMVDGQDVSTLDRRVWRARIGVLFQDYVRYPASLRDNVMLGAPDRRDEPAMLAALRAAGADVDAAALPAGLDTMLWAEGEGGVDLSGGQWQKVAIARLLYAAAVGRRLLVLDEPTAHLDVQTEAAFYDRVLRSVSETTIVLASHRMSTVRHADRIVLLREGRVAEDGTHEHLLALDGWYAHFFRLQAEAFAESRS
jgi:ATP-binding cassette subfamily B protein